MAIVVATMTTAEEDAPSLFNILSPYLYAIVGFIGIINNLFVAVIFATSIQLKKRVENILLFHQSVIDSVTGLMLILSFTTSITQIAYTGLIGDFICKYWMSSTPLWTALQASICNLVIITVERYVEVVHPIFHQNYRNRWLVWITIASTWVFASSTSILFVLYKNGIRNGLCLYGVDWPNVAVMKFSMMFNLFVKYLLPLATFIYCYLRMIVTINRSIFQVNHKKVRRIFLRIAVII